MLERLRPAARSAAALSAAAAAAVVLLCHPAAYAHNMRVFAEVTGRTITGNAYMSGGGNPRDAQVIVLGPGGKELGRTKTDEKGNFRFDASVRCDHTFVIDSGDGHRAECTVRAEELPKGLPAAEGPAAATSQPRSPGSGMPGAATTPTIPRVCGPGSFAAGPASSSADPNALRAMVARTIRNELDTYEQRRHFRDVVAGVGYVFGTWGVMMMVLRRRKRHAGRPGGLDCARTQEGREH